MTSKEPMLTGRELVDIAITNVLNKKAENIVLLNPGDQSEIAEWFLICQGNNEIQNRAIADAIIYDLKEKNNTPWHKEGLEEGRWILLDYSDVIIHILLPELRAYYELEKLWIDYPRTEISE